MVLKLSYIDNDDLFQKTKNAGLMLALPNTSISNLMQRRMAEGADVGLVLKNKYYIKINGKIVKAKNKDVEKTIERNQIINFRSFVKKKKINWNREEGLIKVLNFF